MNKTHFLSLLAVALLAMILHAVVWAQPAQKQAQQADGSDGSRMFTSGVYVPESGEAMEKIKRAKRLADAKEWEQAALLLNEVQEKYGDKLVAQDQDVYISVAEYVSRELASWPFDGIAVYRRLYDAVARQAYDDAQASHDPARMAEVARLYWISSIGAQAADQAAERAMEAGRISMSIDLWRHLLADETLTRKGLGSVAPIVAKLAVALSWDGQKDEAKVMRDRLAHEFADQPNLFGDRSGKLADWVERESVVQTPSDTHRLRPGEYPTLGGGTDRTSVSDVYLDFGAEMWHFDQHKSSEQDKRNDVQRARYGTQSLRVRALIQPVIHNEVVYVTSPAGAFAFTSTSGTPLWRNDNILPGSGAMVQYYGRAAFVPELFSPTYCDDRLYITYSHPSSYNPYNRGGTAPPAGLVCLDATSGRELWRFDVNSVPDLLGASLGGSPLVHRGTVYFVCRVLRAQVFESCHLIAIDTRSGKCLWHRQLIESSTGYGYGYVPSTTVPIASADGNTVYVTTNLGAVAAVAADNGLVRWLRLYDRNVPKTDPRYRYMAAPQGDTGKNWRMAPTLLWNGRVVSLPTDGKSLLVLDSQTGRVIHTISRNKDLFDAGELYGIVNGRLYACGTQLICWDLVSNRRAWAESLGHDPVARGFLTQRYLYIPTDRQLLRVALDPDAKERQEGFMWKSEVAGSIVLTGMHIITANSQRISGFAEWEVAKATAERAIARNPNDPKNYLDYGQLAYATGRMELAQAQLTRAVEVAGGFASLTDPKLKREVFSYALKFAQRTWNKDAKSTLELLTMASLCPPDVEGYVLYRIRLAEYWEDQGDPAKSVGYFQEIITDPEMRASIYHPDPSAVMDAGPYAQDQIDRLIARNGYDVYHAVAVRAGLDYDQALATNNWDELARLVDRYPNATRTRDEIFRLAAHYAQATEYDPATELLRGFRREYSAVLETNPQQDIQALTLLATYQLQQSAKLAANPGPDPRLSAIYSRRAISKAFSFVNAGRRNYGDVKVLLEGREMSFEDHYARMKKEHPGMLALLPNVQTDLKIGPSLTGSGNFRLLTPLIGTSAGAFGEVAMVSAWTGAGWELRGYRLEKGDKQIWKREADRSSMAQLVTYHDDKAIIAQLHRIKAIDPETGDVVWSVESKNGVPNEPLRYFARHENLLLALPMRGRGFIVDLDRGRLQSEFNLPAMVNFMPFVNERVACYISREGNGMLLQVLDTRTGNSMHKMTLPNFTFNWCGADAEGRIAVAAGRNQIIAFDIATGRQAWSIDLDFMVVNPQTSLAVTDDGVIATGNFGTKVRVAKYSFDQKGKCVWQEDIPTFHHGAINGYPRLIYSGEDVYVFANNLLACVDAERGRLSWNASILEQDIIRDVVLSQDYLVASVQSNGGRPVMANGRNVFEMSVNFYDRAPGRGRCEKKIPMKVTNSAQFQLAPMSPGVAVQDHYNRVTFLVPQNSTLKPTEDDGNDNNNLRNGVIMPMNNGQIIIRQQIQVQGNVQIIQKQVEKQQAQDK
ncbi:MAG: Outer membrane protein assembly factor BamB [Phycisphaerae bacterium]|nr:Outer membrane protein assembly factor BamB [Phycisphaerae bacterium]